MSGRPRALPKGYTLNHAKVADMIAVAEGEWVHIATRHTSTSAQKLVELVAGGQLAPYEPAGRFESKYETGELYYEVHARLA